MYTKRFILGLIGVFGFLTQGNAQGDCAAEVSIYTEYYKVKNYADAYSPWKHAFDNCPKSTKNLYIHGPKIVEEKIKNSSGEEKESLIDLLLTIYDQRLENFPEKEGYVIGNKGSDLYKYRTEKFEDAYQLLAKSYELEGEKMQASSLIYFFQAAGKMYAADKISKADFFKIYDDVNHVIAANIEGKKAKYYQMAEESVEKIVAPYADCVDLIPLYEESFEENKEDVDWLGRAVRMMDKKGCTDADIYFKLAGKLYELQPSSDAAGSMGKMAFARKEYSNSVKYYQEAIEGETDKKKLAGYYLEMALSQSKMKQYSVAKAHALKAASLQDGFGRPYLLLASMYGEAAGDCGSNDFERRAVFWAAMDMCAKAKAVDPGLAKIADDLYNSYAKSAPDKTLIFSYGYLEKPTYDIGCWINVSTKVRVP